MSPLIIRESRNRSGCESGSGKEANTEARGEAEIRRRRKKELKRKKKQSGSEIGSNGRWRKRMQETKSKA